jgi:hypothetical protein
MAKEDSQATIYGGPTKRLFVSMLTRDIELDDAILDLLDNCVDGAMRANPGKIGSPSPFKGRKAEITLSKERFVIKDNCGGIPPDYIENAFSLGRPSIEMDGDLPTIGMYGIGMKRAIFKMASEATVSSVHKERKVSVKYTETWLDPLNKEWLLPIDDIFISTKDEGVTITCTKLKPEIQRYFSNDAFINSLSEKISEHFGYIIQKGFEVYLNGKLLKSVTLPLLSATKPGGIQPFDFHANIDGVHVKVTIGFFRPLVQEKEIDEETERPSSRERAGISVICNDRIVLLQDRSMITGWGDGGVPRYHPQFRAIAGLVVLMSNDASKLPVSTTKRGLDVGSEVYLKVRQACMEGMKLFTDFTNKWKGIEKDAAPYFASTMPMDAKTEVRLAIEQGTKVRDIPDAKKFKPKLPMPAKRTATRRISFVRDASEVRTVSLYLFREDDQPASVVGERCFDKTLLEAKNA